MDDTSKCPFSGGKPTRVNRDWWPTQLSIEMLHKNSTLSDPMGKEFDYAKEFKSLDLNAVIKDLTALMTNSQEWWPADFGHYGGLMIRMAWHSAGTYRITDGRGGAGAGQQRFAPLNSWPDNANLDKARRLLWPIKQKYGRKISWADLMVLAGNVALESMGFKTFGFAGGRADVWEPEELYWGPEGTWLGDERYSGERELAEPLGAVQMGLIYVNPEGPNGKPDPVAAAKDIRETFARMAMNDEETVALIAGGHTFGKTHGAGDPSLVGPEPEARRARGSGPRLEEQVRFRPGGRCHHQRSRGDLDDDADEVEQQLLREPVQVRMGADEEPGRCESVDGQGRRRDHSRCLRQVEEASADDADDRPLAAFRSGLREDLASLPRKSGSVRGRLCPRLVQAHPSRHGSDPRYLGPLVPKETLIWQDPIPAVNHELVGDQDIAALKTKILASGLSVSELVSTAWASASTFRGSDKRGGANGARIRLAPQKDWEVNKPAQLAKVLRQARSDPEGLQRSGRCEEGLARRPDRARRFCRGREGREGCRRRREGAFTPGRMDASQEQTDAESFAPLEPRADGFRNYVGKKRSSCCRRKLWSIARSC